MDFPVIHIFQEIDSPIQFNDRIFSDVANQISLDYKVTIGWINYIILPEDKHTELNKQFLKHDYSTDVLTFDFSEDKEINGEVYSNEMVVLQNSNTHRVTCIQEHARMFIHGVLHLIGFDDSAPEDRQKMASLEDKYIKSFM